MSILSRLFPRRAASPPSQPDWSDLAARAHPAITREQRRAAQLRLAVWRQSQPVPGVGYLQSFDAVDLRLADGYQFVIKGYDRFGWPAGHPDSPATAIQETVS